MIRFHRGSWFINASGFYWTPTWLNKISWGNGYFQLYRWLWFGWEFLPTRKDKRAIEK